MRDAFYERRFLKGFPIYEPYGKISGRAYSGKIEKVWHLQFSVTVRVRFLLLLEPRECQEEAMTLMAKIC
jgi:hypothetical protein